MSLIARGITVDLGRSRILHDIDFAAHSGAVTCIVGPNGSGKTTLLRALTGEIGYSGTVTLEGTDIAAAPPWRLAERRGVLPQATALAFPFNVIEVVRLGLTDHRDAPRAAQALARVGLQGYGTRYYQELSGGEKQRVQLARVLAQIGTPVGPEGPRWLFLDEPVSALDIGHQLQVIRIARDFARAGGGVVAVMHDLNLTAMVADSVCVLSHGRKLAHGGPAEVLTDATLSAVYRCTLRVGAAPPPGMPYILPHMAAEAADRA
ncbi:heme ABC transporter ATP-binding protein [Pseudooceanicola sp.]|jgi:iron complex transport system ATP-binding protein|uniref:heme ABC transporter ATP-binding protein n=1 Tax=Pseudooceanicola sp. TaxID=1914328 RepID=UPI0040584053